MSTRRKKEKNRKSLKWFKDLIISLYFPLNLLLHFSSLNIWNWICILHSVYCSMDGDSSDAFHLIQLHSKKHEILHSKVLECGLECVVLSKFSHFLKFSHELFDFGRIIFYSWHFLFETSVTAFHKPTLNLKVEHLVMMNIEMYTLIHAKWSHILTHTIWINWYFRSRLMIRIFQGRETRGEFFVWPFSFFWVPFHLISISTSHLNVFWFMKVHHHHNFHLSFKPFLKSSQLFLLLLSIPVSWILFY